ncbi:4-hydroxythreonine-4-phosphate dehydrogenase PdxA [Membranihabitans maritimus]|uniref:4-hydroxythreonine-4-phosphate dehydrogenase PdxA n=1 Tax=Membranihabitans maritimus TaxID=2904244 RepID=UPI001F02E633|nr:4-hydroxythreonine-4-phosphate dehydrogenase PdxA [Membranihabitans maritimus]
MYKPKIGISLGDVNGIGPEVIIKVLMEKRILNQCIPLIYGSSKVISYHKNIVNPTEFEYSNLSSAETPVENKINIINCWSENVNITLGEPTEDGGKYSALSLERALTDLKNGLIDAVVTAPINKQSMSKVNFGFPGHTEYITQFFGEKNSMMCMVREDLRIGLVTNHIPISVVASSISKELIGKKIKTFKESLIRDFGIEKPLIAVLGLNPHASDGGVIGDEDETIVRPAVIEAKKNGNLVFGPFAADGFFGSNEYKKFHGILAMYHDQGLVPFKLLSFGEGINFTAGLPIVRTSPDHGTGFDIVGKNIANPMSMRKALYQAVDIVRQRKTFDEWNKDPLVKQGTHQEGDDSFNPDEFDQ